MLNALFAMRTQWRTAGMNGALVGLDYGVLPWVLRQIGLAESPELFAGLQVAESEVIKCLAAR